MSFAVILNEVKDRRIWGGSDFYGKEQSPYRRRAWPMVHVRGNLISDEAAHPAPSDVDFLFMDLKTVGMIHKPRLCRGNLLHVLRGRAAAEDSKEKLEIFAVQQMHVPKKVYLDAGW